MDQNSMSQTFPFLRLPAELRNEIYTLNLVGENGIMTVPIPYINRLSLTLVNKQIRAESLAVFFYDNTFTWKLCPFPSMRSEEHKRLDDTVKKLEDLVARGAAGGLRNMRRYNIEIQWPDDNAEPLISMFPDINGVFVQIAGEQILRQKAAGWAPHMWARRNTPHLAGATVKAHVGEWMTDLWDVAMALPAHPLDKEVTYNHIVSAWVEDPVQRLPNGWASQRVAELSNLLETECPDGQWHLSGRNERAILREYLGGDGSDEGETGDDETEEEEEDTEEETETDDELGEDSHSEGSGDD